MKSPREKLHILLDEEVIKPREFFSEQYALARDPRDIHNDFFTFSFDEIEYLLDPEISEAFELIFKFFVDWRVCFEHKRFIQELSEKHKLLPNSNKFEMDFYKSEWEKQFSKSIQLKASIDEKKWLSYLLENAIDLIFDFKDFLFPLEIKAFIRRFQYLRPAFNTNDSVEVSSKNIDNFYDDFEGFYLIERYFKTVNLQQVYENEIINKNIEYLNSLIENDRIEPTHREKALARLYIEKTGYEKERSLSRQEMRKLGGKRREQAFDSIGYCSPDSKAFKKPTSEEIENTMKLLSDFPKAMKMAANDLENLKNS